MPLAKCIITELDGSTKHRYYPLNAVVSFEGNKKPDTLTATFPMGNRVRENYEITYIQDIVDVTYLIAVYPMQLSCFDESGNDVDPTDPVESRFVNVTSGRYKGHYALDFNADAQGINIVDPRNEINISKQFDIHVMFTPDTTQLQDVADEPILWSFRDKADPRGLEFGISGTNGNDSSWKVFIRVSNGTVTNTFTGSDTGLIMTGSPVHIRVKRGQDNLLKAYVNGVEQISTNVPQDLQPTVATNMVFGDTEDSTQDEYIGLIHEIRIYIGTDLTDGEAEKIRWIKPTAQFMKFAGRVVKVKNAQTTKKVICESNSYKFTKAKLGGIGDDPDFRDFTERKIDYTGGTATMNVGKRVVGLTSGATGHILAFTSQTAGTMTIVRNGVNPINFTNGEAIEEQDGDPDPPFISDWDATYTANTEVFTGTFKSILQGAVDKIDNTFIIRNLDAFAQVKQSFDLQGNIYQVGSFMAFASALLLYSETIMYMTPRKNIIIETNVGHSTDYVFDQNNELGVRYNIKNSEDNDLKLVNEVILTGRVGTTTARSAFVPSSGIIRTLRRNVLQIDNNNDLAELAFVTRLDLQGSDVDNDLPITKYRIQVVAPLPHIRYNMAVDVKRKNGANEDQLGASLNFDLDATITGDGQLIIRQIETYYPNGSTVIKVGENDIDYFDDVLSTNKAGDGLIDNTL